MTIFTIGYGGKGREQFLDPLKESGVVVVADVRAHPNRASMGIYVRAKTPDKGIEKTLGDVGIAYEWFEELGNPDPKDPGMQAFRDLLAREAGGRVERLVALASQSTTCLLCAEKDPKACHRSIIADHLSAEGWEIVHL
jgi:uncharacterized protein (DUF488 family)